MNAHLTIQESIESLVAGDDNIIFPEKQEPLDGTCDDLWPGFLHLAPEFYRATGKELAFYPVAVCIADRTIRIGSCRSFDPERSFHVQKLPFAAQLREDIIALMHKTEQGITI